MTIALPRFALQAPDLSYRAYHVWQRNRDVYLRLWKSEAIWPLAEPIITLLALGLGLGELVKLESGQRYIEFIAPGLLAVYPMWAAAGECAWGSFFRMDTQKTFNAIIATPVSIEDVITGGSVGATRALISSATSSSAAISSSGLAAGHFVSARHLLVGPNVCQYVSVVHGDRSFNQLLELLLRSVHYASVLAWRRFLSAGRATRLGGEGFMVHPGHARSGHLSRVGGG
jgi:hypothetical protein